MPPRGFSRSLVSALPFVAALLAACTGGTNPTRQAAFSARPAVLSGEAGVATQASLAAPKAEEKERCARRHPNEGARPETNVRQSSAVGLARYADKTFAYVADADRNAIFTVDVDSRVLVATTGVGAAPSQLLVLADGRVAVALRGESRVVVLEPPAEPSQSLEPLCDAAVPSDPVALAVSPDGATLYVTSGWGRALSALETQTLSLRSSVRLPREPRAVVVEPSGKRAFVSHAVGDSMSIVELEGGAHAARPLDLRVGVGQDGKPRRGGQGFALAALAKTNQSGDEKWTRLFAPFTSVDQAAGSVSSEVYGSRVLAVAPVVAVVDVGREDLLERELRLGDDLQDLGGPSKSCTLPRAAVTVGSDRLLVACLGIDAVLELDARAREPMAFERHRYHVPAGPMGLAAEPLRDRAVVWSAFAGALSVLDLAGDSAPQTLDIAAAKGPPPALGAIEARGRILFHATNDPRISGDARACASCHMDGREDGLTWTTPEGHHQTIMLAGRAEGDGPFGWRGETRTLRHHVGRTMKRLAGRGIFSAEDKADLEALIAYLKVMPAPVPAPLDSARQTLVARGQKIFENPAQGCASCHPGGGSDHAAWDVARSPWHLPFDTPSLRFVGGTAPYFHDGRYATLGELLRGADGAMGHTAGLSADDLSALEAYLEAL